MESDTTKISKRAQQRTHLATHREQKQPKSALSTDCIWTAGLCALVVFNCIIFYSHTIDSKYAQLFQYYDSNGTRCGTGEAATQPVTQFETVTKTYCLPSCPATSGTLTDYNNVVVNVEQSRFYLGDLCVPVQKLQEAINAFNTLSQGQSSSLVNQLPEFGPQLPIFVVVSVVLTLFWICILKRCAETFIKLVQFLWIVCLLLLTVFTCINYGQIHVFTGLFGDTNGWVTMDWILTWFLILLGPLQTVVQFCWLRRRLLIAARIIEAGCDAFGDIPSSMLIPFCSLASMLLAVWFWVWVMLSILGSNVSGKSKLSFFPQVTLDSADEWLLVYAFVNLVQWVCFLGSVGQQILCCMFTNWYQQQDGKNDLASPPHSLAKAVCRTALSIGTVAIGSVLITIATLMRIVLFIFSAEQKAVDPNMNVAKRALLWLLNCIAWVVEKICQQFTKQGFIHASFTGENFCSSAWTSMCLNLQNISIFTIVQATESLISTGTNLCICAINTLLAQGMFCKWMDFGLTEPPQATLALIFVVLQFVNAALLEVWDLATDCVMQCFFFEWDRKGEAPSDNCPQQLHKQLTDIKDEKKRQDEEGRLSDQQLLDNKYDD